MKAAKPKANVANASASVSAKPSAKPRDLDPAFVKVMSSFASDPTVTVGGKFGSTSLARAGKVFVLLMRGELVAKLPAARVDAIVAAEEGTRMVMGKRTMKEWVVVPTDGRARWLPLAREAHAYVG
jgi:hypothetical protein